MTAFIKLIYKKIYDLFHEKTHIDENIIYNNYHGE